jgi:hypothetical protein
MKSRRARVFSSTRGGPLDILNRNSEWVHCVSSAAIVGRRHCTTERVFLGVTRTCCWKLIDLLLRGCRHCVSWAWLRCLRRRVGDMVVACRTRNLRSFAFGILRGALGPRSIAGIFSTALLHRPELDREQNARKSPLKRTWLVVPRPGGATLLEIAFTKAIQRLA